MMNDMAASVSLSRRPVKVMRTFTAALHIERESVEEQVLDFTANNGSYAVQSILFSLEQGLRLQEDDAGLRIVDLEFGIAMRDAARARKNIAQPLPETREGAGSQEKAKPKYPNSYRIIGLLETEKGYAVVSRIAERFSWENKLVGTRTKVDHIDAKRGLQQLIMSWMRPRLEDVPVILRPGVCQQAAQQLLSHVGLLAYGKMPRVAYPTLQERRPEIRLRQWRDALMRISRKTERFEYLQARELFPWKYGADDPRGDRSVIRDPDWIEFVHSPFPKPFPLNFVTSNAVVLYERTWQEKMSQNGTPHVNRRVYAALPLFDGVPPESRLRQLAEEYNFWWREHLDEFRPLGAWRDMALDPKKALLLVPLDYDADQEGRQSRFRSMLEGRGGRKVNWSLVVQRHYRRGEKEKSRWELHIVTSREVTPIARPFVLGLHFAVTPIIFWALADRKGTILEEGRIEGNPILSQALAEKLHLEEEQKRLRWVGNRAFSEQLKQHTVAVCREILALAAAKNASIALESIKWVDKRTGGPDANQRFSFWNYGQLIERIKWLGLERSSAQGHDSVEIIRTVGDYVLRYTCPQCGACRTAGASPERALTIRIGETLDCRRCDFSGPVPEEHQAQLVARMGTERLR